ncbi:hypothetical protein BJX70DRAFT_248850 [Aspergillus crustosus]
MGERGSGSTSYPASAVSDNTDTTSALGIGQAREQRRSPSAHGPDIYVIEDFSTESQKSESSVPLVKPYAIEEPDHGTIFESERISLPQQRHSKPWEDLVMSMEDLYCDSDNSSQSLSFPKIGRKRKPATIPSFPRPYHFRQSTPLPDIQYKKPALSPKRPRKRNQRRQCEENIGVAQGYRTGELGSSSSGTSISPDTSYANSIKGSPTPGAMDID